MYDQNDIPFSQYSLDFFGFFDYLFRLLYSTFGGSGAGGTSGSGGDAGTGAVVGLSPSAILAWLSHAWSVLVVISWIASALLLCGLVYAYIRASQLGEVVTEILKRQEESFRKLRTKDVKNARWQDVLTHAASDQPSDWKLAIIEADIVLDELLTTLGYTGTSIGEKLKTAPPTAFRTLDQAWRAHNVRNRIAHEGAGFDLTKKTAQETITQYKMVFDEFNFV